MPACVDADENDRNMARQRPTETSERENLLNYSWNVFEKLSIQNFGFSFDDDRAKDIASLKRCGSEP